jgi:hypothetical protein
VERAEQDDEEDHLEEGYKEVRGCKRQSQHTDDGGPGTLQNGDAERVQAAANPVLGLLVVLSNVVVADVRAKVDREADAHDEVDEGNAVQPHAPPGHVPEDADLDGDDGERDPKRADWRRDENERNDYHDGRRHDDALNRLRKNLEVLVDVDKPGVKDANGDA